MSDNKGGLIRLGILMVFLGIAMIAAFIKGYKIRSYSKELPTSKVRSAAIGPIELKGKIIPSQKTVVSNFSNEKCVYTSFIIQKKVGSGKRRHWSTIVNDLRSEYFFLKDETGNILVDSKKAIVHTGSNRFIYSSRVKGEKRIIFDRICAKHGIKVKAFIGRRAVRMKEINILADAKNIYLLGYAKKSIFNKKGEIQKLMVKYKKDLPYIISTRGEKAVQRKFGKEWTLIAGIILILGGITFTILQFYIY